jgi:hypothetical protein
MICEYLNSSESCYLVKFPEYRGRRTEYKVNFGSSEAEILLSLSAKKAGWKNAQKYFFFEEKEVFLILILSFLLPLWSFGVGVY